MADYNENFANLENCVTYAKNPNGKVYRLFTGSYDDCYDAAVIYTCSYNREAWVET